MFFHHAFEVIDMINAVSGYNPYSTYSLYGASYANRAAQTQGAQRSGMVLTAQKVHQPEAPVQPVTPARPVSADEDPAQAGLLRFGSDPAEMAVRMRITPYEEPAQNAQGAQKAEEGAQIEIRHIKRKTGLWICQIHSPAVKIRLMRLVPLAASLLHQEGGQHIQQFSPRSKSHLLSFSLLQLW